MSALATAVFKATIGLLVNKGRDKAAERLKEGDARDPTVYGFIIREIDEINLKLDGLAKKDLLASISFFKEGILLLSFVFDKARYSEHGAETVQAAARTAGTEAFSVAKRLRKLELTGLDEAAMRSLDKAKRRFREARRRATEAFANEALELSDRVLAMQYRVMATVLEEVDNPADAVAACRVCIEELHSLSAVKEYFKVELGKGFKSRFSKEERRHIISTVCHANRVIYDVTQMVACRGEIMMLPYVDIGEERVDPLRDRRVAQVLKKEGMEHCSVTPWSFEEQHKVKDPRGITTNTHGQFIIADDGDKTLKVFDSNGDFLISFNPQTDDADTKLDIFDVATDAEKQHLHVLVGPMKPGAEEYEREVLVYKDTADPLHKFPVKRGDWGRRLTVSGSKVLVFSRDVVHVYELSGKFLCTFGEGKIKDAEDITAANDGRVVVMDCRGVHLFIVEGHLLYKFNINIEGDYYYRIASLPAGEHVVVAGVERETYRLRVAIFATSGELVRRIELDEEKVDWMGIKGMTVTMEGQIAVVFRDEHKNPKVLVIN